MANVLALKRDTTIGITPAPNSGIMTFCDNVCFEPSQTVNQSLDLLIDTNRIIIRIYTYT